MLPCLGYQWALFSSSQSSSLEERMISSLAARERPRTGEKSASSSEGIRP